MRPVQWFDLGVALTWQDPQYKSFTCTDNSGKQFDFGGNQLIRVPKLALRVTPGINLFDDRFRGEVEIEHYTRRYAGIANTQPLPAFTNVNLNMRAEVTRNIALGLNISNLFDTLQLTEGKPCVLAHDLNGMRWRRLRMRQFDRRIPCSILGPKPTTRTG